MESDGVPLLVKKCVQIIEEKGLKAEGVYRVSRKKEDIIALQEKYDEGNYMHDIVLYPFQSGKALLIKFQARVLN